MAIFTKNKIIITLILLFVILGSVVYFFTNKRYTSHTEITGQFLELIETDQLFTGFAFVSTVDLKYGFLKRDLFTDDAKEIPIGGCRQLYEISVGYTNISDLISFHINSTNENIINDLPNPKILAINPISSKNYGKYTKPECDSWNVETNGYRKCQPKIKSILRKTGQWDILAESSKKIIASYINLYREQ